MRLGKVLLGAALGVFMTGNVALATHPVPSKANKLITLLTKGYQNCATPNDSTTILPLPACSPAVEEDAGCNFQAKGKGILKAIVFGPTGGKDIKLIAVVTKLDCPGEIFSPVASFQITTHDCASGNPCTTADVPDFPLTFPPTGTCTVDTKGNCKIKATVDTGGLGNVIQDGNDTNLVLRGCGFDRSGAGPGVTFRCGLFW